MFHWKSRYTRILIVALSGLSTLLFYQNCSETQFSKRSTERASTIENAEAVAVYTIDLYDQSVPEGQSLELVAVPGGDPAVAPFFRWKKDGQLIGQTETPIFTIQAAALSDSGSYSVEYYSGPDVVADAQANVTVVQQIFLPEITAQPTGVSVYAGQSIGLTAAASGDQLSYQWMRNGAPVAGQTAASLTIGVSNAGHAGQYLLVVSNPAGSVESNKVQVNVQTVKNANQTVMTSSNPRDQYWGNDVNFSPQKSYNLTGVAGSANWKSMQLVMTGYRTIYNRRAPDVSMTITKGSSYSRDRVLRYAGANEREQRDYFRYDGGNTITIRSRSRCTRDKCGSAHGGGAVSIKVIKVNY